MILREKMAREQVPTADSKYLHTTVFSAVLSKYMPTAVANQRDNKLREEVVKNVEQEFVERNKGKNMMRLDTGKSVIRLDEQEVKKNVMMLKKQEIVERNKE